MRMMAPDPPAPIRWVKRLMVPPTPDRIWSRLKSDGSPGGLYMYAPLQVSE